MPSPNPLKAVGMGNQSLVHDGAKIRAGGLVAMGLDCSRGRCHGEDFVGQHLNQCLRQALFILDALLDPSIPGLHGSMGFFSPGAARWHSRTSENFS